MLYMYPQKNVPIIQVSINSYMDAVSHYEIGRWLRPLRLLDYLNQAPHARFNHPTPDHYLPLPCILGTSYDDEIGQVLHRAIDLEILALDAYGFGIAA